MMRQEYLIGLLRELAQTLARVLLLKQKGEFDPALEEIDRTLRRLWDLDPGQPASLSVDQLAALCRREEEAVPEKLVALADLLGERADIYRLQNQVPESQQNLARALGLYLEALSCAKAIVSVELLSKVDHLIEQARAFTLAPEVLRRLFAYFEVRGRLAQAEDTLFDWLETGDPAALSSGLSFYQRLADKDDGWLIRGGLPREEVEEGRRELLRRRAG